MNYKRGKTLIIHGILVLLFFCFPPAPRSADLHPNQITIRNDRVFVLNGHPYFPIGVCFELGENAYNNELKKPGGSLYGFNFINLFTQNANLYNCFHSKDVISGDLSSGSQYDDILGVYWDTSITAQSNYERIKAYLDEGVYLLADDFAFHPDDYTRWAWNNIPGCADDININPPFNQQVRNAAIEKVNSLALMNDSRVIGHYAQDDANMFTGGPPGDPLYYYNNYRNIRMQNFIDCYDHQKSLYPNSLVLISLPPSFFPRVFDYNNWQNVDIARNAWVNDAVEYIRSANVLFAPGSITQESYIPQFQIYETKYPKWYPQHIKETLVDRVLSTSVEPKAILGGIIFDVWQNNPIWNDPKMNDKVKWEIYVSLEKGVTGLIFYGWHKKDEDFTDPNTGQRVYYRPIWDAIRHQVDTLVNIKRLDSVFVKTNYGQIGYTLTVPDSADVSYAIYKAGSNSWSDYYLLVTNNPIGSLFGPDEGSKNITFTCNAHNFDNYSLTEEFSGNSVQTTGQNSFSYSLPWFGSAMFHISLPGGHVIVPDDFYLRQNYPNPFNPVTQINYGLKTDAFVTVKVYNSIGQLIKTVVSENRSAGEYAVTFDGTNLSSGIYFYKMSVGGFEQSKKMVMIR